MARVLATQFNPGVASWSESFRPSEDDGTLGATLYVATTGSDTTGDGSAANPWATIRHAVNQIGTDNFSTKTLVVGPGTFDFTGQFSALNEVEVEGSVSVLETVTVTAVVGNTEPTGIIVTQAGSGWVVDEFQGSQIRITSGPAIGAIGFCYRNTADTLYITTDSATFAAMGVGNTLDIYSMDTTFSLSGNAWVQDSAGCSFTDINFVGVAYILSVWMTSKVVLSRCYVNVRSLLAGETGALWLDTTYVHNTANRELLRIAATGYLRLAYGTVLDGTNAAAGDAILDGLTGCQITTRGEVVFRELDTGGILLRMPSVSVGDVGAYQAWLFDTCAGGLTINGDGTSAGGWIFLPDLHGAITDLYLVVANYGALTVLGGASTATSGGGALFISADGGAGNVSSEVVYGTIIRGGNPP